MMVSVALLPLRINYLALEMSLKIPLRTQHIDLIGFVLRCAAAASMACWLSDALGLTHTVWASMSALIVSQEDVKATRAQVAGRVAGTIIGALVALAVHRLANLAGVSVVAQIAIAVSICALIAKGRSTLRVCLWTCPLVLLTTSADISPELTALSRTAEVLLGALVGGAFHIGQVALVERLHLKRWVTEQEDSKHENVVARPSTPTDSGGE